MFFVKLAFQNLRKNKRAYLPFFISMIFLVALNTVAQLIITNPDMAKLPGGASAQMMFGLGGNIIIIFSVIFAIYTNSFLLKQRQREFGLYNVLGMGKRELYRLVFWENVFSYLMSIIAGLITGFVFGKLSFLILRKLLGAQSAFGFHVAGSVYLLVTVMFLIIYILLLLIDILRIRRTNPIELLHSDRSGEKEPKSRWLITIIGLLTLGTGYYWAVTIKTPLDAISLFFVAIVLVIIGTYCLFIAGSVTLLKFLKHRPNFYYKANHFISVSNMIYRMKQNAAGLASICILSTMVLVTMATTVSLYIGRADTVTSLYPYDLSIQVNEPGTTTSLKAVDKAIADAQDKYPNVKITEKNRVSVYEVPFTKKAQGYQTLDPNKSYNADTINMQFITTQTYERLAKDKANISGHQVIAYPVRGSLPGRHFQINGTDLVVQRTIHSLPNFKQQRTPIDMILLVMPNQASIDKILKAAYPGQAASQAPTVKTFFDFKAPNHKTRIAFKDTIKKDLAKTHTTAFLESKDEYEETSNYITGGFLFLGIIFGIAFTLATALIIYYKQVSEGLDDKKRFEILQKVGMDRKAIKKVIHSQIMTVFFFPIIMAIIHLVFAFSFIKNLLLVFGLVNGDLILWTTIATVAIFVIIYFIVYQLTAKAYYKIVERQS
ncbi:FtsX-like permease family protein [Agrilactobacillus yilanensis]|uniref:FtsX-like permease family protein n=1 Tax=Agrilactobacillus yilanensis TaxID=2485997 RepID=A0ABW4J8X7_9LACO|nr:FtsX-like permease family protein [Agrilactobacillus yilanensis]